MIPRSHLLNLVLLGGTIAMLFALNYAVDPFGANGAVDLGLEKRAVAEKLSYTDWKAAEFRREPHPVVLFGDSRMDKIDAEQVASHLDDPVYNFAFGGGTLADMVSAFWFADAQTELKHVVFGLNANLVNDSKSYDRADQAISLLDDPLRYYFSPFVTSTSAKVLWFNWGAGAATTERPPMDEQAFWDFQLDYARGLYRQWAYPEKLLPRFEAVLQHCEDQNITATVIWFPTHRDLQVLTAELDPEIAKVKAAVSASGARVWDYDRDLPLTQERSHFTDPFHFTDEVASGLVDEVFGSDPSP